MDNLVLQILIHSIPHAIFWKDEKSIFRGCNKQFAQQFGYDDVNQILGKSDYDLPFLPKMIDVYHRDDQFVMKTGTAKINYEEIQTQPDGTERVLLVSKVPLYEGKTVIGLLGIYIDITKQKFEEKQLIEAKKAAEVANQAKSEFIANISHDVRTPLTGIITFSRFLKDEDVIEDTKRKEIAEDTYNAGQQLLVLLNSVLDVVSADLATDEDLNKKSFDLRQMVEELIQLEKPALKTHHLELLYFVDENIPQCIVSDKMKLHRILLNLIGNAIKFTKKGHIKFTADLVSKNKDNITITFAIEDTGIGIPQEFQSQIFERFYKVNSSYKSKYKGTGIGLHIVQKYVQLLGGNINFQSIVGKGTTFFVTLTFPIGEPLQENIKTPIHQKVVTTDSHRDNLKPVVTKMASIYASKQNKSNIKILLIEDSILALKALKILFMPYSFSVKEAINAEDAFELIKNERFDLIITDLGLPGMQGDELILKIRQLETDTNQPRKKIIALTGHIVNDKILLMHYKKIGFDEIFQKPMLPDQLKAILEPFIKISETVRTSDQSLQEVKNSPPLKKGNFDLPKNEALWFQLYKYPEFDIDVAIKTLGSKEVVYSIMASFKKDTIDATVDKLTEAYQTKDWLLIDSLAHKLKGEACFGTVRLYYAAMYLENYLKTENKKWADNLYYQLLQTIDQTLIYLNNNILLEK